jgi:hypothetical protein
MHLGDIWHVLASNHTQEDDFEGNEAQNFPEAITVGDIKYYLSKGGIIEFHGDHHISHMKFTLLLLDNTALQPWKKLMLTTLLMVEYVLQIC